MENEKKKKDYSITSKGVETIEVPEFFKSNTLAKPIGLRFYAESLESEEYKKFEEPFSFWSGFIERPKIEETHREWEIYIKDIEIGKTHSEWEIDNIEIGKTHSESEIDIKDRTINTLAKLLRNKEKIIKKIRFEISQKNKKIDDLQTTQKLDYEKLVKKQQALQKETTEKISSLEERINVLIDSKVSVSKAPSRWIDEIINDLEEEEGIN